ncbi:MAG: hypothetical protein DYH08_02955 [Actinobacteria bacterium ATB1]|nr:hypothetical protein [Actinobacteria bacterium ATB1]
MNSMTTYRELLSRTKADIEEINFDIGQKRLNEEPDTVWIDIREADEYENMFLGLKPDIAVITNIEWDHPD